MIKQKLIQTLALLGIALAVFMISCGGDDPDDTESCTGASMSCTYNGASWAATEFNNTLFKGSDQGIDGKRLDIRGTSSDGIQLVLTINETRDGTLGDCIQLDTWDAFLGNNSVIGHVFLASKSEGGQLISARLNKDSGNLTVTECDEANKTISGTFEFIISDFFTEQTVVDVVSGTFKDLCYTVN